MILSPLAVKAQELPPHFRGKKVLEVPPQGYEFPLELIEFRPWLEGSELKGFRVALRARRVAKDFTVREISFQLVHLNGNPVEAVSFAQSFSTKNPPPELPALEVRLPHEPLTGAPLRTAAELHFQADAYLLISPPVLEMMRLGGTQIVLRFPVVTRISRAVLTASEQQGRALELARYFAPIIYQQTNDPRRDFITKFNFDGNWRGDDNADNVDKFPLPGYVYYSFVESASHYFLGYYFFHPYDYTKKIGPACGFFNRIGAHENDLEGIQLVVEKDGSAYGNLLLMEAIAHLWFHQYENSDRVKDKREVGGVLEDIDGHVEVETGPAGVHPKVYVECLGHGVWAYGHNGKEVKPGNHYVVYRVGEQAEEPEGRDDRDVRYQLIDVFDPAEGLWNHRDKFADALPERPYTKPETFWDGFGYSQQWGSAFFGDDGSAARPPWGWKAKGTHRGDWVMAPTVTFSRRLSIPGLEGENLNYVFNPFLKPGGANPALPAPGADEDEVDSEHVRPEPQPSPSAPEPPAPTAPAPSNPSAIAESSGPAPPGLADLTEVLFEKRGELTKIDSLEALLKTSGEILLPLVSGYVKISGSDASKITFRYKNVVGLKSLRLYWKTDTMQDFDEEHSVQLHLSTKPGWHWQTLEMMELESFDRLATITQFKADLEFDKESFHWSTSPTEILETLRNLPQAMGFFLGRSDYLKRQDLSPAPPTQP